MLNSVYIEDVFEKFYDIISPGPRIIQTQDMSACHSFYSIILSGQQFTQNQANYLLKILDKYKIIMMKQGFDYQEALKNPTWKNSFRSIDLSRKVWIEKDEKDRIFVGLRFPYQLRKEFEENFHTNHDTEKNSRWDPDRKIRTVSVYNINLIHLSEFVKRNGFDIDETFEILIGEIEEIWQNQETLEPVSLIENDQVILKNAPDDAKNYFDQHKYNDINRDMFLAKSMGYKLNKNPENLLEKIATSTKNLFWIKTNQELLSLYNQLSGKVCIILDRAGDNLDWLKKFADSVDKLQINRSDIKVCFRASKGENEDLNRWIKDNGFGGSVEDGKILIFHHKPAKWLFKNQESVKLLVSTNLYPSTNPITRDWFASHPCVIYLGDIKPSEQKGKEIVEL